MSAPQVLGATSAQPKAPLDRQGAHPIEMASMPLERCMPDAERRQLTVLFCDLVDPIVLASQLDPEDWREVVRAYQETCAAPIQRYDGHIAQYLGDGLLVYFGDPRVQEDDTQRAVLASPGILEGVDTLNARLERDKGLRSQGDSMPFLCGSPRLRLFYQEQKGPVLGGNALNIYRPPLEREHLEPAGF